MRYCLLPVVLSALLLACSAATALDEPRDGLQAAFGGEFDGSSVAVAFSSSDLLLWAAASGRHLKLGVSQLLL